MENKRYWVEGYGCALSSSETEKIRCLLGDIGMMPAKRFQDADLVVINACAVKATTEQRMLSRIEKLFDGKKKNAELVVFGCLPAVRKEPIKKISEKIVLLDTKLESLCCFLNINEKKFSPALKGARKHEIISIIPVATGCIGNCAYCITKLARGDLCSYSEKEIEGAFRKAASESKEIWLTSQDLGCYGLDINSSLPKLLKRLLNVKGKYFVRLGMMNPGNFKKIRKQLMPLFKNKHLYKFLHLPVQSGSGRILKAMGRKYNKMDFLGCVRIARSHCPEITIATDVIVGFPGETRKDFEETLSLLSKARPDVVNISRYGKRPGTLAARMQSQLSEAEKKARSRELSSFCRNLFLEKNSSLVGEEFEALVSEKAKGGFFTARTENYRPVLVRSRFGKFIKVRIMGAHSHFFDGEII